jgi:hypothetical protein
VRRRFAAAAMTRRISATLLSTPLIRMNLACVISAITRASVVLPLPGGPEKITDGRRSASIARRSNLPRARICSCPTNSSSERGRMRVASGAALFAASMSPFSSNRSCTRENTLTPRILHLVVATALRAVVLTRHRRAATGFGLTVLSLSAAISKLEVAK